MTLTSSLFCFGLGYVSDFFCQSLQAQGWRISGTRRSPHDQGPVFDGVSPNPLVLPCLASASALLISIPPSIAGDPTLIHYGGQIIERAPHLSWVGYLSSTSVYGHHHGAWVDEGSPCTPSSHTARMRYQGERDWLALHEKYGVPVHIFRLSGIYGPKRNQLERLREGTARHLVKEGHVFSRIHVEDIVQVLQASLKSPSPGAIYNVSDDVPDTSSAVLSFAASLLDVPCPPGMPVSSAKLSPMEQGFYQDSKRVSNRKIKEELGVALLYPSYKEGLQALYQSLKGESYL